MTDPYTFRPRKKRVAAYFNDGKCSMSVECAKEHEANPDPLLVQAVQAAKKEFNRVYRPTARNK